MKSKIAVFWFIYLIAINYLRQTCGYWSVINISNYLLLVSETIADASCLRHLICVWTAIVGLSGAASKNARESFA